MSNWIKNFLSNLKSRADFKFHLVTIFPLLIFLLTFPAIKWLPVEYTYENHLVENFQLVVILMAFAFCLKAKVDKKFFTFLALVMTIIFLREVNCGRTIFFLMEGLDNAFYTWKDIKYGYLVNPIYGLFIAYVFLYFIFSKSYLVLWKYFTTAKLSIYNWIFLFLGMILGTIGEETGNCVLEEMTETLFYLSLMALIYLQGFNQKYIETTENKN